MVSGNVDLLELRIYSILKASTNKIITIIDPSHHFFFFFIKSVRVKKNWSTLQNKTLIKRFFYAFICYDHMTQTFKIWPAINFNALTTRMLFFYALLRRKTMNVYIVICSLFEKIYNLKNYKKNGYLIKIITWIAASTLFIFSKRIIISG